jgi:hypothetical protein
MSILEAVQNIEQKIADSAGSASPEELAMLATAADRIGGRATVLDVVQAGRAIKDEANAEITDLVATKTTEITDTVSAKDTEFIDMVAARTAELHAARDAVLQASADYQRRVAMTEFFNNHFFANQK